MGLTGRPPGVHGAALLLKPRGGNPCPFLPAVQTTCAPPPSPEGWLCSRHSDPPVSVPSTLRACDYTGAAWKTQDNLHIFRSADLQPPSHLLRCSLLRESGQSHSCRDARVSFGGHGSTDPGNSREASSWAWAPRLRWAQNWGAYEPRTELPKNQVSRSTRRRSLPTWHVETSRGRPGIPAQMKPSIRAGPWRTSHTGVGRPVLECSWKPCF